MIEIIFLFFDLLIGTNAFVSVQHVYKHRNFKKTILREQSDNVPMELWQMSDGILGRAQWADYVYLPHSSLNSAEMTNLQPIIKCSDENKLFDDLENMIGAKVVVDSPESQAKALSLVGSVEYLLLNCLDWSMIPAENLVAAAANCLTKIVIEITSVEQVQGAAFALFTGVDGLLIPNDDLIIKAATEAKKLRSSNCKQSESVAYDHSVELLEGEIVDVSSGGIGDRVCLDLVRLLNTGEGLLIGSSAKLLALVHGETFETGFVPARPFRVNAGPVHSYVLMADLTMKYLSEVRPGDQVLAVRRLFDEAVKENSIMTRPVTVGRCKIETRPLLMISFKRENSVGQIFLQQAETVRLVSRVGSISVTDLKKGDEISIRSTMHGTHVGKKIDVKVTEL